MPARPRPTCQPNKPRPEAPPLPDDHRVCLHCRNESTDVQVRCDECQGYICQNCHWCHEFQANHEIRVCDRCDAFYCRACDEMDQCDDCGEVVCAACSTLLSCKFCGGGLCEDCATACGRCGIVLCSRDAKFAVECDTCRLSYCLVCLASGNKDPCVRCSHRPSKRMEQLVHLRLKSIYKAFKQSNHNLPKTPKWRENDEPNEETPESSLLAAAASAAQQSEEEYYAEKEKADAAAAALLEELEEEEKLAESKKKKKNKKKKKKEEGNGKHTETVTQEKEVENVTKTAAKSSPPSDNASNQLSEQEESKLEAPEMVETTNNMDSLEQYMVNLVAEKDVDGLEDLLNSIKGVPGRANLRKNAKKAIKRIRALHIQPEEDDPEPEAEQELEESNVPMEFTDGPAQDLLKIVNNTHAKALPQAGRGGRGPGAGKMYECVLHMAPYIVGWVIGKGGERIRAMMEESGARIWIDQESVGKNDPRIVYVSGQRNNVDTAVRLLYELIESAPAESPAPRQGTSQAEGDALKGKPHLNSDSAEVGPVKLLPSMTKEEIFCEARFVPLLIGRRGWTIKHIQDTSGARVDIDQSVTPRKITVSGTHENVQTAVIMIRDVLSYPHAQLQESEDFEVSESMNERAKADSPVPPLSSTLSKKALDDGSPPPSSFILTGDARSTVSATSSLSSTPEPSSDSPPKSVLSVLGQDPLLPSSLSMEAHVNTFGIPQSPSLLESPFGHNHSPQNSLFPPSGFAINLQASDPNVRAFNQQTQPYGARINYPLQQPVSFDQGNYIGNREGPFPSSQHGIPLHNMVNGTGPNAPINPMPGTVSPEKMWNHPTLGRQYSNPVPQSEQVNSSMNFLQNNSPRAGPLSGNDTLGLARPAQHSSPLGNLTRSSSLPTKDESHIVDSLFGPADEAMNDPALLSGLQDLALNSGSASGLWGSSGVHSRPSQLPGLNGFGRNDSTEHSPFFATAEKTSSILGEDKRQSRFAWDESR